MVSRTEESRAAGYCGATTGAIPPNLTVGGIGVEIIFQIIAAASHAPWAISSATASGERNGVRGLRVTGNGDGGRAVDGATSGQRVETAENQIRIVYGAGGGCFW